MARILKTPASLPLWTYKAFLLVAAAIWGLGTVVIKSTVDAFPPAWIVGVRFTAAGIILGVVMLPRFRKRIDAEHLCKGSVLGVMVFLAYWSNSTGLTDTTASNSAFLTSLYCVIIPFLGWALHGPRPTRFNLAAAVVCVAGVGCVSFAGAAGFSLRFGDLITLLSALFLSFHVVYTAKFAPGCDMTLLTVIQFLVAGLLGLAAGLALEPMPNFAALGADTWTSLAYLAVFASCDGCTGVLAWLLHATICRSSPSMRYTSRWSSAMRRVQSDVSPAFSGRGSPIPAPAPSDSMLVTSVVTKRWTSSSWLFHER